MEEVGDVESSCRAAVGAGRQSLIDSLYNKKDTATLIEALEMTGEQQQFSIKHDSESGHGPATTQGDPDAIAKTLCRVLARFHSRPEDCRRHPARQLWTKLKFADDEPEVYHKVTRIVCKYSALHIVPISRKRLFTYFNRL